MKQNLKPLLTGLAFTIFVASSLRADDAPPSSGLKSVGTTNDACRHDDVSFKTHDGGTARVKLGEIRLFKLPAKKKELFWRCGATTERCANGEAFTWVRCVHLADGRIDWTFYTEK